MSAVRAPSRSAPFSTIGRGMRSARSMRQATRSRSMTTTSVAAVAMQPRVARDVARIELLAGAVDDRRRPVGRIDADDPAATRLEDPQRVVAGGNHLRGHDLLEAAGQVGNDRGILDAGDAMERVEAALHPASQRSELRGRNPGARRALDRGVGVGQEVLRALRVAVDEVRAVDPLLDLPDERGGLARWPGVRRRRAESLRSGARSAGPQPSRRARGARRRAPCRPSRAAGDVPARDPTSAGCCAGTRVAAAGRTRGPTTGA